jgi:3-oxoisoapionate decarboxylase
MITGIYPRDLPPSAGPAEALRSAADLGFGAVQFGSVGALSVTLDPGELGDMAALARSLGVQVWFEGGMLNACHLDRAGDLLEAGEGDLRKGLHRVLGLAGEVFGERGLTVIIGKEEDRFDPVAPWAEQLGATATLLRELAPVVRDAGARLLVKTHEEITTAEVLRLIDEVGADVLGVAFDPVNVVVRLEEPSAAGRRVAEHVAAVHLDDAQICSTPTGFHRRLCPLGEGVVGSAALPDSDRLVVDFHRAELAMPCFDPNWLAAHPDARPAELAWLSGAARVHRDHDLSIAARLHAARGFLGLS